MYVIVWRFVAKDPLEFERHYGPSGTWASLFARSAVRADGAAPRRRQRVPDARFLAQRGGLSGVRAANRAEYEEIDRRFEALTEREERLGDFVTAM